MPPFSRSCNKPLPEPQAGFGPVEPISPTPGCSFVRVSEQRYYLMQFFGRWHVCDSDSRSYHPLALYAVCFVLQIRKEGESEPSAEQSFADSAIMHWAAVQVDA